MGQCGAVCANNCGGTPRLPYINLYVYPLLASEASKPSRTVRTIFLYICILDECNALLARYTQCIPHAAL